jgi:ABC-type nickel/cobalt efflux system permease component RcnA
MRGSRSFAAFPIRREDDKQEQLENYFKHSITVGIVVLALAVIVLSIPLAMLFMSGFSTAGVVVALTGMVAFFIGTSIAIIMIKTTRRITKDTELDLSEEQKLIIRKSRLLYIAALVIPIITLVGGLLIVGIIKR